MPVDDRLAGEDYCYLTTVGRVTGKPHTIEIWFGLRDSSLYLLSGGGQRSDWVKNARREPAVTLRIADRHFRGRARVVTDAEEDALARRLLIEKYGSSDSGDLSDWRRTALPVGIEIEGDIEEDIEAVAAPADG